MFHLKLEKNDRIQKNFDPIPLQLIPISGPEDENMPDLESDQEVASQKDDRRGPQRPTNSYPKRRKRAIRARKNNDRK